jgi:hypothetical protein
MTAVRLGCVALAALLVAPLDTFAQGRGHGRGKNNGNGPAFCRSGQGHPVHGWAWCRDKGWTRDGFWDRIRDRDDRARRRDDRDRDRDRDRVRDRDRDRRDDGGWWPF